jgi:hypothetical protein
VGLPPLLWSFPPTTAFTSFPAPDCWACAAAPASWRFVYRSRGRWVFPPPPVEFSSLRHSHKLSRSSLMGTWPAPALFSPARPGLFIYSSGKDPLPPLRRSVRPTLFPTCLYCSYCFLVSFSFFPRWGSVCPGGYADLAQGCLWKYGVPLSSPCGPHLPKPPGHG